MSDQQLEAALALDQHIKTLAKDPDPVAAFNAIADLFEQNPGVYEGIHAAKEAAGLPARNPGPDGNAMATKMLRNVQAAQSDFVFGMNNPKRDPKQAALAATGKYKDKTMKAIQEGRWEKSVANYDVAAAREAATSDGGAGWATGVAKRETKIRAAMTKLAPLLASVSQTVQQLPQDNDAQREQRMVQNLRLMRQVGTRFRGG